MPWRNDFRDLRLGIWLPFLSPFKLHSFLWQCNLLIRTIRCLKCSWIRGRTLLTCLERYHGLDISGTSGRMKKPITAIGREMIPSMMKSLSIHKLRTLSPETCLGSIFTIASLWGHFLLQGRTHQSLNSRIPWLLWRCLFGKCRNALRAHPFDTKNQLCSAFQDKIRFPQDLQGFLNRHAMQARSPIREGAENLTDEKSDNVELRSWIASGQ